VLRIVCIILLLSYEVGFTQTNCDSVIYWNAERKLNWNDFKGTVPDSADFFARSAIRIETIGFWEEDMPNYKIVTKFYRYNAWTKDTASKNLLQHEQVHFDIAELYARKIRKGIGDLRRRHESDIAKYIEFINKLFKEYSVMTNIEYDTATDYSRCVEVQQEWNERIAKKLYELRKYAVDYPKYLKR